MNEAKYIAALRARLPPEVYSWKIHDRFTAGVPDLYIATANGKSIWIEVKYLKTAPKRLFSPRLSTNQRQWLEDHARRSHAVCVIVGSPAGATIFFLEGGECSRTAPANLSYTEVVEAILDKVK